MAFEAIAEAIRKNEEINQRWRDAEAQRDLEYKERIRTQAHFERQLQGAFTTAEPATSPVEQAWHRNEQLLRAEERSIGAYARPTNTPAARPQPAPSTAPMVHAPLQRLQEGGITRANGVIASSTAAGWTTRATHSRAAPESVPASRRCSTCRRERKYLWRGRNYCESCWQHR